MAVACRRAVTLVCLLGATLGLGVSPASADCVRAQVSYTSPDGSTTTLGPRCLASTPFLTTIGDDSGVGLTSAGYVSYSLRIPLP